MKIDKDIPIPRYYPFDLMEVGDSFPVEPNKRSTTSIAIVRYNKKYDGKKKFLLRKLESGEIRCWRVK